MSVTYIRESTKFALWGRAAGRCQYEGCNVPLWRDNLTKAEFNTAYIAHIVADQPDGPRGDVVLSKQLKQDSSNLMLMCDEHHRLIDKHAVAEHSVDRLQRMKRAHEERVELAASVQPEKCSHVLLYGANIGAHTSPVSYHRAVTAMMPDWYPASASPFELGLSNSATLDRDDAFWALEERQLRRQFEAQVKPRLVLGATPHLSVFAMAPQPLLVLLGFLLSDIPTTEVYQLHREPPSWRWDDQGVESDVAYRVEQPRSFGPKVALNLSLSATIHDQRIVAAIGGEVAVWTLTIPEPNNDFLRSRRDLANFRRRIRRVLDLIKAKHADADQLHVFPAVPVAIAVELGRVIMPKADLPLQVYDENRALGGFVPALCIRAAGRERA